MLARILMRSAIQADAMILVYLAGAVLLAYMVSVVMASVVDALCAALERYRHRRALRALMLEAARSMATRR